MDSVNILGTEYIITFKNFKDDEAFERRSIGGYCDSYSKKIVVCNMATCNGYEYEPLESIAEIEREILRHEIVHAFFHESGLADSSCVIDGPWAENEEMVDWIANQGEKIFLAWCEAGALSHHMICIEDEGEEAKQPYVPENSTESFADLAKNLTADCQGD